MRPTTSWLAPSFAIFILLGAAGGFFLLTRNILQGRTQEADEKILLTFRTAGHPDDPLGPQWLEHLARDVTGLGSVGVVAILTIAAGGFLLVRFGAREGLLLQGAIFSGMLLYAVLKIMIDRPRPESVSPLIYVETPSYPAGHAMQATILYLGIAFSAGHFVQTISAKLYLIIVAIMIFLAVGVSRVYLGAHWPTDVVAGWLAGLGWSMVWWLVGWMVVGPKAWPLIWSGDGPRPYPLSRPLQSG